jgi:hypothetical protein
MKFLRSIPGLVKRHYEKVILALALVGLVGAVFYLNAMKSAENEKIEKYNQNIGKRKPKPVPSVDVTALLTAVQHATNPPTMSFSPPHNLFNPVKWQKRPDGTLLKVETGREVGPQALEVVKITALQLIITLDQQSGSGVNMSVTQEAHTNRNWRGRMQSFLTTNSVSERNHRSRVFVLHDFKVTPDGPVAEIDLNDGGSATNATVSVNKPFTRVDGYKVDLSYPPEKKNYPDRRVGDILTLAGEDYIIVAITQNEVVVSARSNDRRTTIRNNAAQQ